MIHVDSLSKRYQMTLALNNVSFDIAEHEVVGLLGLNGAGKTTLMKILTGYLHPSSGKAVINDMDVTQLPHQVQAMLGYMPENVPLYPDMLVQEYLQMIAELRELPLSDHNKFIGQAIEATGLEKHLMHKIAFLSKGYRQRVGLAQAILHQPKVLILDEPTSGLDPNQIVEIRSLIKKLSEKATVLLSTHILSEVEASCERALIIADGELYADETIENLQQGDSTIVAVEKGPEGIKEALLALDDVEKVESINKNDQHVVTDHLENCFIFRINGQDKSLSTTIYDLATSKGWRLAELHRERRNLEGVFRSIVAQGRKAA